MILTKHELKQSAKSLAIWTLAISAFMMICIFIYPDMKDEMGSMGEAFASMGTFSKAFGLDVINFGTFKGYYAVECGNLLGMGGALFAALISIAVLAKEEGWHTSEFLFAHPISRRRAVAEKSLAVFIQLIVLNVVVFALSAAATLAIGEEVFWRELMLLHLAFFILQVVIAAVCIFFSALIRGGGMGLGLGFALVLYFINLVANISESAKVLKYFTPFSFAEAHDIITAGSIEIKYMIPSICVAALSMIVVFPIYSKKDLK